MSVKHYHDYNTATAKATAKVMMRRHLRDLPEKEDAVGRAGVKGQSGGLVPDKLCQKFEDDGGNLRLVCPRLQAAPQSWEVGWV